MSKTLTHAEIEKIIAANKPLPAGLISIWGNVYLEGYSHPLPAGLISIWGNVYLEGYSHPLPAGLTVAGIKIPVVKNIDAKILAAIGPSAEHLDMTKWHCGTSHCRAGWAIQLAGPDGAKLEAATSPETAGALIYAVSRPGVQVPDFRASNDAALADLKRWAEKAEVTESGV